MEGDIKPYFDTIDHHSLINILRRRIKDEAFIELIWKFLNAGYMENWEYNATFSSITQGSGINPILANIYLNEFDRFMGATKKNLIKERAEREIMNTPESNRTGKIKLYLPKEKWAGKLLNYGVLKIVSRAGEKEVRKPLQRNDYIFLSVHEMVRKYNAQIRGIYNYYSENKLKSRDAIDAE